MTSPCAAGAYASFAHLAEKETEGEDFVVQLRAVDAALAVLAPHGGGIEPGTAAIADAVAGTEYAFYAFRGIKKAGNRVLHLPSTLFDEPRGAAAVESAQRVISIHGCAGAERVVFVGGRDPLLRMRLLASLRKAGFRAEEGGPSGLEGTSRRNLCNRCQTGAGAQLEISRGLREQLLEPLDSHPRRRRTPWFDPFVAAIRSSLPGG